MAASSRIGLSAVIMGLVCVVLGFVFHSRRPIPDKAKESWKIGYWVWAGETPIPAEFKPEILYVEVSGRWWPHNLPEADHYVVVRRIEPEALLTRETASSLVEQYKALAADAGARAHIAGLQIDYDSPTKKLKSYAGFLKWVRQDLPSNASLSITAMLDWFRPGTAIQNVMGWIDEFVPQFYDAGPSRAPSGIAEPMDVEKWAPRFNTYAVPYRIGIASFGRVARRRSNGFGRSTVQFFRDAGPLDFIGRRELSKSTETTAAGELVVRYDVTESMPNQPELASGDVVEITFPTEMSVRTAYQAVRRFGGYCAGAIFFRWPNRFETLAFTPSDLHRIVSEEPLPAEATLEIRAASCIERQCSDLFLDPGALLRPEDQALSIRAIGPVQLFLPSGPLRPVVTRANQMFVRVPAYAGLGKIYLGRMISTGLVRFEVTQP